MWGLIRRSGFQGLVPLGEVSGRDLCRAQARMRRVLIHGLSSLREGGTSTEQEDDGEMGTSERAPRGLSIRTYKVQDELQLEGLRRG